MLTTFEKEFVKLEDDGVLGKIVGNKIKLKDLDGNLLDPKMFEIAGKNSLKVFFSIEVKEYFKIVIEGIEYILFNSKTKIDSEIGEKENFEKELSNYVPITCNVYKSKFKNGAIIVEPEEVMCDIFIEMYTNESFPDEPIEVLEYYDIELKKGFEQEVSKRGYIYLVRILVDEEEVYFEKITTRPLNYFSSYSSIINDLQELNLFPKNIKEEYIKKLIGEKSTLLKMRFGISEEQSKDVEMMPIFKSVVNLYCIKDMIPLGYISGELSSSGEGVTSSNSKMSLGNLSVSGGDSSGSGSNSSQIKSLLATNGIQDLIAVEEEKLKESLFKGAKIIKKQLLQGRFGGVKKCQT